MIVVRSHLQAQFGHGQELANVMSQAMPGMLREIGQTRTWRVLTDLSGIFDNVVLEVEAESLADWEQTRPKLFGAKSFQETMAKTASIVVSGHNQFFTIEGRG